MTDKNGREIKTGNAVMITGAYFKNDNGLFKVIHSPGDENWLGDDHCLYKMNKDGSISKSKYKTSFWPLSAVTNNFEKNRLSREHNKINAQIEVIDFAPAYAVPAKPGVKFLWNGIKVDGVLHTCRYSAGPYNERSKLPEGTITIWAKTYSDLPRLDGATIENNTDSVSDYCEKDRMRILPDSKYYADVKVACEKAEARRKASIEKKYRKTA
jgi:hypothetical protein